MKKFRLKELFKISKNSTGNFTFYKKDIRDSGFVKKCFKKNKFDKVVHLAAQAGVRYSLKNPKIYLQTNIMGFFNIIESCKDNRVKHLIFASTSSVYGANRQVPFKEVHTTDSPLQLYAVTKKSNELMAHAYSSLYNLRTTGLRFFTVYGPWGRPDMALFDFTQKILNGKKISLFNHGNHSRDFTYIDDVVDGIYKVVAKKIKLKNKNTRKIITPYEILNIGNGENVHLKRFIKAIEKATSKKARSKNYPIQPGDIKDTFSSTKKIQKKYNYKSSTKIEEGVFKFVDWYRNYHKI